MAQPFKAALREIEGLLQPEAFDPAKADLTVSIAVTDYAQRVVILPFFTRLRQQAPAVRISVQPVDMALITPQMAPDTLRARKLFNERYVGVMRAGHPAAHSLDLDTFCRLDHAIMSHDGTQFRGATDKALEATGRQRRVVVSVPSFVFLIDILRDSDLCALLPHRLVRDLEGLAVVEPPLAVPGFTKLWV